MPVNRHLLHFMGLCCPLCRTVLRFSPWVRLVGVNGVVGRGTVHIQSCHAVTIYGLHGGRGGCDMPYFLVLAVVSVTHRHRSLHGTFR
jgi:hypothetical protein